MQTTEKKQNLLKMISQYIQIIKKSIRNLIGFSEIDHCLSVKNNEQHQSLWHQAVNMHSLQHNINVSITFTSLWNTVMTFIFQISLAQLKQYSVHPE